MNDGLETQLVNILRINELETIYMYISYVNETCPIRMTKL